MSLRPLTPKAPSLPLATTQYERRYLDQLNNILRLYFNQLDNVFSSLFGLTGGASLQNPIGSFILTTQQTIPVTNTAYAIPFNTTSVSNQVAVGSPTSRIITSIPGYYNFQFSAQLAKTSGLTATIWLWARVNGVDIPNASTKIQLEGLTTTDTPAAWNFIAAMNTGDYFELCWASDQTTALLAATAANAFSPAIPPVLLTTTFVSALYT